MSQNVIIRKSVTRHAPDTGGIISRGAVDEERVREVLLARQKSVVLRQQTGIVRKGPVDAETQRLLDAGYSQEVIDYLRS